VDTCSTGAIRSLGDKVAIEAHLCAGCGGCASVCPTGAISHDAPRVPDAGLRMRRMLAAYVAAGGRDAVCWYGGGERRRAVRTGQMSRCRGSGITAAGARHPDGSAPSASFGLT
jgi:Fe-S-cluster-containing hydrogenase component 2